MNIELTGLVGSSPLGAFAAFGLLRCCEELDLEDAKLSWRRGADWHAVLTTEKSAEDLIELLVVRQKARHKKSELCWADSPRVEKGRFCEAANEAVKQAHDGDRTYADFLAAFTSDVQKEDEAKTIPTAFLMTSGRQQFLEEARKLARNLGDGRKDKSCSNSFSEALFGPWRYDDDQHSLGWDPATERIHAFRAKSPTKESSQGVAAAVWLAFEAMPLFPCFFRAGRLATTAFSNQDRVIHLTWPIWTSPVGLATVKSLLALAELAEPVPDLERLRLRGIEAAFRSQRYKVKTQGNYFILRPAYPI